MRLTVLDSTGKKLTLWLIVHEFVVGHSPPTTTSRSQDVIHVIGFPRPSPFFVTNQRAKKRGRPGNKAISIELGIQLAVKLNVHYICLACFLSVNSLFFSSTHNSRKWLRLCHLHCDLHLCNNWWCPGHHHLLPHCCHSRGETSKE